MRPVGVSEHRVEPRTRKRSRWTSKRFLVIRVVAVLALGVVVPLANARDECEEAPELSKLTPPRARSLRVLEEPPPPPGPAPKGRQAARNTESSKETGKPDDEPAEDFRSSLICDEQSIRGQIFAGDELYRAGEYAEAVKRYEAVLNEAPDLAVAHHNAGLAYLELFRAGSGGDKDQIYAKKATEHLVTYLDSSPDDSAIESLVTETWRDAEHYDSALRYWKAKLEKAPENRNIMSLLALISREAGRFEQAIDWYERRAEASDDPAVKVEDLVYIGKLQLSRLRDPGLVGDARIEVADRGIAALQTAAKVDPESSVIHSYLGSIYQLRARAHDDSSLREADLAQGRAHLETWAELRKN